MSVVCQARAPGPPPRGAPPRGVPSPGKQKIERGFFSEADPKAEVYPIRSSLQNKDVTKRGGRYESDFIWNTNWAEQLDYEEALRRQQAEGRKEAAAGRQGDQQGRLHLRSKADLNSMDVDLSAELKRQRPQQQQQRTQPSGARLQQRPAALRPSPGYEAVPPTRGEIRSWTRGGKYGTKPMAPPPTAGEVELAERLAAEAQRYEDLKRELFAVAGGLALSLLAATYIFYGRDVAASYGVGALGGLLYLRLLNRSIDGVGGAGGVLSQPRLLIPIAMAMGYHRYHHTMSGSSTVDLQLLPMLLGFFTYKGAVVAKQAATLFSDLAASAGGKQAQQAADSSSEGESVDDVTRVDRAFTSSVLKG